MLNNTLKRLTGQKADRKRKGLRGFTLVEILIVLVILAILAAAFMAAFTGYIDKTKEKLAVMEARRWFIAAQAATSEVYASHKPQGNGTFSKDYDTPAGGTNGGAYIAGFEIQNTGVITSATFAKVQAYGINSGSTDAERIAYMTLQYMDSASGSADSNEYNFNSGTLSLGTSAKTPDEYFALEGCNDDIAVNINFSEFGRINTVVFARRGCSNVIEATKDESKTVKSAGASG